MCFNKSASFLGKKTLLRQQTEGVSRRLVQFTLADSNAYPHSGSQSGGRTRWWGVPTSGAFGHILGCAIALGYIRIAEQGLDAMLSAGGFEIEIACQRFPAQATLEAAYDSENLKPRM